MADENDRGKVPGKADRGPVSKLIRERALAVLRDTRSKIDPKLLDAMKERLSQTMPPGALGPTAPPAARTDADMPLSKPAGPAPIPKAAAPMAAAIYKQTSYVAAKPETPVTKETKKPAAPQILSKDEKPRAVYPAKVLDDDTKDFEAVDKQKVAKIVLQYMKNREDLPRN